MSIISKVIAVSADDRQQARFATEESILALGNDAAVRAAQLFLRFHAFDPDKARLWLRFARSEQFSEAALDALDPFEQALRVQAQTDALGNFFRSINMSIMAWAPYREAHEEAWGFPRRETHDYWRGQPNTPGRRGEYAGLWRDAAYRTWLRNPMASRHSSVGAYVVGHTVVTMGRPSDYRFERVGTTGIVGETSAVALWADHPTGESHRLFMQEGGKLYGGYSTDNPMAWPGITARDTEDFRRLARGGQPSVMSFWDGREEGGVPPGMPQLDWRTGEFIPQKDGGSNRMNVLGVVPPLKWYWRLWNAPRPGLRAAPGGPDLSLLDYLAARTPYEMVREVWRDAVVRNEDMARNNGIGADELARAAADAMQRENDAILREDRRSQSMTELIAGGIGSALGLIGGVPGMTAGGNAGRAVAAIINVFRSEANSVERRSIAARRTDVFGRLMPVLERVTLAADERYLAVLLRDVGLPPGVPAGASSNVSLADTVAEIYERERYTIDFAAGYERLLSAWVADASTVRVEGMPPYGGVEVDGVRLGGAWEGGVEGGTWVVAAGRGTRWVRVNPPGGERGRMALVPVTPQEPTLLRYAEMPLAAHLVVVGMPSGIRVEVDAARAVGRWGGEATTGLYTIELPEGPRSLRFWLPGREEALVVEVEAAGLAMALPWANVLAGTGIARPAEAPPTAPPPPASDGPSGTTVAVGALALFAAAAVAAVALRRRRRGR